jgi:tetratricopeptide (TPR) repeat protein
VSSPADIYVLRYVLEHDPASPLFYELAVACFEAGRLEEAEKVLRSGLAIHRGHLGARVLLGVTLARLGEAEGAREELKGAAAAVSGLAASLYPALASVCKAAGDTAGELAALRLAAAHLAPAPEAAKSRRHEEAVRPEREPVPWPAVSGPEPEDRGLDLLRGFLQPSSGEAPPLESQVAAGGEAAEVIALLQRWLQNIREETGH